MLAISLSSIPPRFDKIGPTLESLLCQTARVDSIRLYIPRVYRRFPDYDGSLPKVPAGIEIHRPETDLGPASKVLFAARDLRDTPGALILFCDDDRDYPANLAADLLSARVGHEDEAICAASFNLDHVGVAAPKQHQPQPRAVKRTKWWDWDYRKKRLAQQWKARKINTGKPKPIRRMYEKAGYADIFEGWGGVLVRPDFFDDTAYDIPPECWHVDDVWLSGIVARNRIPIWNVAGPFRPMPTGADTSDPLSKLVVSGNDRDRLNLGCVRYIQKTFGVWI